jgi:5-methylcytosine-specific restriction enzyme A
MSNARRSGVRNTYRAGYIRSPAWFARRDRWFRTAQRRGTLECAGCDRPGTPRTLELHHLFYRGVRVLDGRWLATEAHDDLIAMHPLCHELLHRLIDRDRILAHSRTHRDATRIAITRIHTALTQSAETR